MARRGRPTGDEVTVKIDKIVEKLAKLGLTIGEISKIIEAEVRSLWREHREAFERGHGDLIQKLRGAQIDKALKEKNSQMLIHLGKHYLHQTDYIAINQKDEEEEQVEGMETADLISLVQKNKDK